MPRKRAQRRRRQAEGDRARPPREVRLPDELQRRFGDIGLELARKALLARQWKKAFEFAEAAHGSQKSEAEALMAEASARQARRCALSGRFPEADEWAAKAVKLRPASAAYQERRRLIKRARESVLAQFDDSLFPDTVGPSSGKWWRQDLLAPVRGWDGGVATVRAPKILAETARSELEDVYAVGIYQPWHVSGPAPLFTKYLKSLKPGGKTIPYAAILLRQGLCEETDWIEEIDVLVPIPTSLRSFKDRGFELTEELAKELGARLCVPVVDALEIDPDAPPTHSLGGYRERARALAGGLRVKKKASALLSTAEAALIVDDIVTYGSTFEACAIRLRKHYPRLRLFGGALAYTETPERRERAEAERSGDG